VIVVPKLDENGVLTWADEWVALSPLQARLTAILLEKFTEMVSQQDLALATQGARDVRRNSLDVQMHRLRRKLAPKGLVIRTVRKRGYVLEPETGRPNGSD
jgi:DNA-binding response OmpR family regulator